MKRMSTWDRSYIDSYTPLLFSYTSCFILYQDEQKYMCIYANTMCSLIIEKENRI
jgi:hypothetical protein